MTATAPEQPATPTTENTAGAHVAVAVDPPATVPDPAAAAPTKAECEAAIAEVQKELGTKSRLSCSHTKHARS